MTAPDDRTITYGQDADHGPSQTSPSLEDFNLFYANAFRRAGLAYPNGVTPAYSYNLPGSRTGAANAYKEISRM